MLFRSKIYNLNKNEIDLEITTEDIEKEKEKVSNSIIQTYGYNEPIPMPLEYNVPKNKIFSLLDNIKTFLKTTFSRKKLGLPDPTISSSNDVTNTTSSNIVQNNHSSFVSQLDPNNPIYDHSKIVPAKKSETYNEKSVDVENEIINE